MPRVADDTPLSDVVVDDAETDKIQYIPGPSTTESDGRWTQNSGVREDFYYRGTVSYCNVKECRLEFPFKGTAIAAYGVTSTTDNTTSWWQVDNGKIYVFEPDREGLDRTYHLRLYQSEELPFGEHTLYANVTYLQRGSFALDWIEYNATSTPTSSSTSLIPPSATSTSSRSASPPAASPDSSSRNSGLSFSTKATIAGGVVGGVLIPVLLYWLYKVWRRRRSQGHARRLDNRPDSPPPPFSSLYDTDADEEGRSSHHSHNSSDMGLSATMSERQPMLSSGQPAGESTTQSVYHPGRESHLDDHTSPTEDGPSQNVSDKARRSTEPRRDDGSMEELPPAYSP
ncbi:hypothetical protein OH76DRAFT_944006 [Lentinus brumalis]|uniref:Mid2 domain-containing protein n=1 Tax=Lentinus brumalis TaxID=2498619 RepID=A0A371CZ24_9APHY|nr:hypothetical protein OH76DRAFT_944006 [Polyporus brumalis]